MKVREKTSSTVRSGLLRGALVILLLSGWLVTHSAGEAGGGLPRAAEFELKDQYGQALAYRFPNQQVNVLIFGDREGSAQIEGWVRPLYDAYQERVKIRGVAVLSSVPNLLRPVVRRIFKAQVKYSVLLDWDGDVSRSYRYQARKANVFVITRRGEVVAQLTGAATPLHVGLVCSKPEGEVVRALGLVLPW